MKYKVQDANPEILKNSSIKDIDIQKMLNLNARIFSKCKNNSDTLIVIVIV